MRAGSATLSSPNSFVLGDFAPTRESSLEWNAPAKVAACLVLAYYFGAKLGFALTFQPHPISVLWPPNAMLLTALLLTSTRFWWLMIVVALPAHLAAELQSGVPLAMVLGWFVSNCSEALIGAALIRRFVAAPLRFDAFRHVGVFLVCAVFLAPLLSSFLDAGLVRALAWGTEDYWRLWRLRFFSNVLATLTLVPVAVIWTRRGRAWLGRGHRARLIELLVLLAGLFAVSVVAFDDYDAGLVSTPAIFFLPLPFLLWAAVRLGPLGTSTALLVVVMLAILGAVHNQGPFVTGSPEENARSVQLFLIAMGLPMLLFTASVEEQRQAKDALELLEERSAKICRASPHPIAMIRRSDGRILDVNDRWESMFGYARDEAIGRTALDLNLYVDAKSDRDLIHVADDGGPVRDLAVEVRNRLGQIMIAMLTTENVVVGGEPCMITLLRDVTDQRLAEREAHEQRQQLTHLSRVAMLGELSGALAHELNQPLTAILSNAQAGQRFLGSDQYDEAELRDILQDIVNEDRRAGEVIRRLRALLKKGEAQYQLLQVEELVHETLALAHSDMITRNIQAETHLAPNLPTVWGDRIQLEQVLLNLVINACEAMSSSGADMRTLRIEAHHAASEIHLAIADDGPAVLADDLEKLFESFFTTKQHGLGLGLSISRWIVTAHGGRIWATANPGGGATLHVVLPVHATIGA